MKTLISNPQFTAFISNYPSLPRNNNRIFLNIQPTKPLSTHTTTSCSCSADHGGWSDLISGDSSNDSNQLNRFLGSLGIDEKKYAFVYLFGFVCALGFSRVRVSSIIIFPACFLVFAVGFSFGVVNRWDLDVGLSLFGKKNKKKRFVKDDEFRVSAEKLKSLGGLLNGFDEKFANLKRSMQKDVDLNRISRNDLVGYIESVELIEQGVLQAKRVIEGYMDGMVVDANDESKSLNNKPSDQTKKVERQGFDFSQFIAGFQRENFIGLQLDLCDKSFPTILKGKFYRIAVRPAMLYGADCWAIKKAQVRKMEVAEMRMLRWMCGHTRLDRITNVVFRERLGVANIADKIREWRLRWFGHVKRRHTTNPVRSVENITIEGRRGRGRPKLTWDESIRHDLIDLNLSEDMVEDRNSWRSRIIVKDF